ncbi:MAG: glycosyltransferase [Cyanobacteria bacterium J06632_3]
MVYSHDAFGLGNLRRMLAICEHLLNSIPDLSILLLSGSPMIHEFRLPKGLDYIKLPCLNRGISGQLAAKYLGTSLEETVVLRSQLIQLAAAHFKPDILLVDKKPTGLKGELTDTLDYLQNSLPLSKRVLLLRDILDAPKKTIGEWVRWRYYQTIQAYYDQVLVVGMQSVFDLVKEYRLPPAIGQKVRHCGYIRKQFENSDRAHLLASMRLAPNDPFVLVTPGGGEDGYSLVHTYIEGMVELEAHGELPFRSLVLCGPEMPLVQQQQLEQLAQGCRSVIFHRFTNHLLSYMQAADVTVSMCGYNTVTEVLSMGKRAVVIPRTKPSQEQLIRAGRFAKRKWLTMIHPDKVTGRSLIETVLTKLTAPPTANDIDFDGLPNIARCLNELTSPTRQFKPAWPSRVAC